MAYLSGFFERFKDIESVSALEVSKYLKSKIEIVRLQNIIANQILYPQTIPLTKIDEEIDRALLCALLQLHPEDILKGDRITLPEEYLFRFPEINQLITSLTISLNLPLLSSIYIKKAGNLHRAGTILKVSPDIGRILVNGKVLKISPNKITVFPFGNQPLLIEVPNQPLWHGVSGSIGLIVDSRRKSDG